MSKASRIHKKYIKALNKASNKHLDDFKVLSKKLYSLKEYRRTRRLNSKLVKNLKKRTFLDKNTRNPKFKNQLFNIMKEYKSK